MKNVKTRISGKITVDPTLDERYGEGPLFPHKIERIKNLLKDTKMATAPSKTKTEA